MTHSEPSSLPLPSPAQARWQDLELGFFCHFGLNTFHSREWGDGTDCPASFNPSALDARQWAQAAKDAGFKYFMLTAKHHDGFCLWPTKTTEYSVCASPWKNGGGDVVRECADACREIGLLFGLYLSPWDRNALCYPDAAAYDDFYAAQLTELLTGYGPLVELWFDGAGSEGRSYDWPRIMNLIKTHQPDAMVFNMGAPTIRWVGNEDGVAPDPCWNAAAEARSSMFTDDRLVWLPETPAWVPAECDVPLRTDRWFWRPGDESRLRSLEELVDIYCRSAGHGAGLLLNVAPDDRGLLPDADVKRVQEFGREVKRRFGTPLAETAGIGSELLLTLPEPALVACVVLMENIAEGGERVREYAVDAWVNEEWRTVSAGTAIGHKKIDLIEPIETTRLRWRSVQAAAPPLIRRFAAYSDPSSA